MENDKKSDGDTGATVQVRVEHVTAALDQIEVLIRHVRGAIDGLAPKTLLKELRSSGPSAPKLLGNACPPDEKEKNKVEPK